MNNTTELVFILDRSGSMEGLEADTIGGFNAMIERQKALEGRCLVSTVLFDNTSSTLHDRLPLPMVPKMTVEDYIVGGGTALLDAIGGTIDRIRAIHRYARAEDVPRHTLFIITTDGMENASSRYTARQVRQMIKTQKREYGWEFVFLGANIDAADTAQDLGIDGDMAVDYIGDQEGTQLNYQVLGDAICAVRQDGQLTARWKDPIERDYTNRRKK